MKAVPCVRAPQGASAGARFMRALAGPFLSVPGSTLFFGPDMSKSRQKTSADSTNTTPPLFTNEQWRRAMRELKLTRQQSKVVALILAGQSDKQIASEMSISVWTVRTHLRHVFAKHDIKDRVELVLRAFAAANTSQKLVNRNA